ncbi:hypothetical protein BH23BAC1_BH23BAC1_20830 [soil metagenome]
MKLFLIQMLLFASMVSCENDFPVEPETLSVKLLSSPGFLKVQDSTQISVLLKNEQNFDLNYQWSTNHGFILGEGSFIKFIAPNERSEAIIKVKISDQFGFEYQDSVKILIYKQFVILKADDLVFDHEQIIPENWKKFIDLIEKSAVKASIGIIGNSLESGNSAYFSAIKDLHYKGIFEFWNHGYDHMLNGINDKGEKYHEFKGSSLDYQKRQIHKTQTLAKEKLGIKLRAFGAPGNAIDFNTITALEADTTIRVWFYGDPASTKFILARHSNCEIEFPVHHASMEKFTTSYDKAASLLVLQLHPNSWDTYRFEQFKNILQYLQEQEVTFVNPFEFYKLANNIMEEYML